MTKNKINLDSFLKERSKNLNYSKSLRKLLIVTSNACKKVSRLISCGEINGILGNLETQNVQGEVQKKLDVLSNEIFIDFFLNNKTVSGLVSEENELPIYNDYNPDSPFTVFFDPLDGSSNIDVNGAVGSIFSIFEFSGSSKDVISENLTLVPGRLQIASAYSIYGPSTMFVISLGSDTCGFTLDKENDDFILTHPSFKIPDSTSEFSINSSNERFWQEPVKRYVKECIEGVSGVREKDFNMRWTGSMVADIHRILTRGGIFMYPKDFKKPEKPGRLRLMYEANPMALLVESAGGLASTGKTNLLDVQPEHLHQRIPVIIGSKKEVERIQRYYSEENSQNVQPSKTPLFNDRSLFYKSD